MLDEAYRLVEEFQYKAGHPVNEKPTLMIKSRAFVRYKCMHDELDEFITASNIYEQADSIMDLIYYAIGTLVELGVHPDDLFLLLHEYNMKKVQFVENDESGRVKKPSWWHHPDEEIKRIIDDMI